jgi:putative redox protein
MDCEKTMELKVSLQGNKKVATTIGDHLIVTDQPVSNGGSNTAPAPYDLFLASIATCAGFYVQSYCESKGLDASGIDISLVPTRDDNKSINGFVTTIRVPESIPARLHGALKKVAEQCAVKKTIMNNPTFIVETVSHGS